MFKYLSFLAITIFLSGLVSAQEVPVVPASLQPAAKGYLLGPGDQIAVKVLGEEQFDFLAAVDEDGKIEVPFFDKPIIAKCRSERELRSDVTQLLTKYLRNPQINLRVTERKSRPPVAIYGEVKTPGQIELRRKTTLVEIVAFSGGVTDDAGGLVEVFRTQPPVCAEDMEGSNWKRDSSDPTDIPSRMYSLASVKLGKDDANPVIYPGDVIVVQKASPVFIIGEVVAPTGIYIKEGGLSLAEAIGKVGGVRREAKTKDIKIYRLKPGFSAESKDREIISANYDQIRKGLQKDIMLQPQDIIEVDKAKDSLATSILKLAIGTAKQGIGSAATGAGYRILY